MNGEGLPRKRSAGGALTRMDALHRVGLGGLEHAPEEAAWDDALDALACAWTALRWLRGEAEVLGGEFDETNTPMRIVC